MTRTSLVLAVLALGLAGCRKPQPSPDYIAASNRYTNLIALHQDAAYAKAEMADVIAQLGRVPAESSDYQKAQALIGTIESDKQRAMSDEAKRMIAMAPPTVAPNFPPLPKEAPAGPEAAPADAGAPVVNELAQGSDFARVNQKYAGCLLPRGPVTMIGQDGKPTEMAGYDLHESAPCRTAMPQMTTGVMLVRDGKIAWVLPKSSLQSVQQTVLPADAGTAAPQP